MDSNGTPKQQLVERLKSANNILVTVSRNPSVDQLAACIGLTLVLNKLGKHATAVFSGQVPSTIEFLKPDETLERNTDSLRDFIIALDKSKADKLRYKVEDTVVKIFITPYRTSLSADDLEFSQGDFNVDAVVAIGVKQQQDLDDAITAHGRILHDAVVTTINTSADGDLGTINWHDPSASSLCELAEEVVHDLGADLLDGQVATALLTGIVAETNRFSNEKTTPQTMSVSAALMTAGANQQLVASEIGVDGAQTASGSQSSASDDGSGQPAKASTESPKPDDGTLEITHQHDEEAASDETDTTKPSAADGELPAEPISTEQAEKPAAEAAKPSRLITEPPVLGGTLTASSKPETEMEAPADPLSLAPDIAGQPLLTHSEPSTQPAPATPPVMQPAPADWVPPTPLAAAPEPPAMSLPQPTADITTDTGTASTSVPQLAAEPDKKNETLSELEKDVASPHLQTAPDLDDARSEVLNAINSQPPATPEPIQALNAQPVALDVPHDVQSAPATSTEFDPQAFGVINDPDVPTNSTPQQSATNPLPNLNQPALSIPLTPAAPVSEPAVTDPNIPPVPPPLPPSVYAPPTNTSGQQ